jgi:hypothetical protein
MMRGTTLSIAVAAAVLLLTGGAAAAPPSIEADGEEVSFSWGDGRTISLTALVDGLNDCTSKVNALQAVAPQVSTGNADFTSPATLVLPIGKMAVSEVARITFSIAGCASELATGFAALLTGNPSDGTVDVFITTSRPGDFGGNDVAGTYQFGTKKISASEVGAVLMINGGISGMGCKGATWTVRATSNQGTLDLTGYTKPVGGYAAFDQDATTMHLTADVLEVDNEIANTVFPRLNDAEESARAAQATADTNGGIIKTQETAIAANADSVTLLGETIELVQEEVKIIASDVCVFHFFPSSFLTSFVPPPPPHVPFSLARFRLGVVSHA